MNHCNIFKINQPCQRGAYQREVRLIPHSGTLNSALMFAQASNGDHTARLDKDICGTSFCEAPVIMMTLLIRREIVSFDLSGRHRCDILHDLTKEDRVLYLFGSSSVCCSLFAHDGNKAQIHSSRFIVS